MASYKNTPFAEKDKRLRAQIDYSMNYYEIDGGKKELAKMLGISRSLFYDKLKNPNLFRVGELRKLAVILHWTDEETQNII